MYKYLLFLCLVASCHSDNSRMRIRDFRFLIHDLRTVVTDLINTNHNNTTIKLQAMYRNIKALSNEYNELSNITTKLNVTENKLVQMESDLETYIQIFHSRLEEHFNTHGQKTTTLTTKFNSVEQQLEHVAGTLLHLYDLLSSFTQAEINNKFDDLYGELYWDIASLNDEIVKYKRQQQSIMSKVDRYDGLFDSFITRMSNIDKTLLTDLSYVRQQIAELVNRSDSHNDSYFKLITQIESMEITLQTSTKEGIRLCFDNTKTFNQILDHISSLKSKLQNVTNSNLEQKVNELLDTKFGALTRPFNKVNNFIGNVSFDQFYHEVNTKLGGIEKELFAELPANQTQHQEITTRQLYKFLNNAFNQSANHSWWYYFLLRTEFRNKFDNIPDRLAIKVDKMENKLIEKIEQIMEQKLNEKLEAKLETFFDKLNNKLDKLSNDTLVAKRETTVMLCRASP